MKNHKKPLNKEAKASIKFWNNFSDNELLLALMFVTTGNQIITMQDVKNAEFNMGTNKEFREAIHEAALTLDAKSKK
jgi:hypothetical protein